MSRSTEIPQLSWRERFTAFRATLLLFAVVLFAFGARRIPYSTIGLLQYIGPTIQMLLAVFVFGESFSGPRVLGFVLIWSALALYAGDGVWRARKANL